jgi:hypothetical protein
MLPSLSCFDRHFCPLSRSICITPSSIFSTNSKPCANYSFLIGEDSFSADREFVVVSNRTTLSVRSQVFPRFVASRNLSHKTQLRHETHCRSSRMVVMTLNTSLHLGVYSKRTWHRVGFSSTAESPRPVTKVSGSWIICTGRRIGCYYHILDQERP